MTRADRLAALVGIGFVLSFAGWLAGAAICGWALRGIRRQRAARAHLAFLGVLISGLSMFATWALVDGR